MNRQHFIDWIRVITIGLLVIYHAAIGFQPWGGFIGFITHLPSWQNLWLPMTMLNIWRIPMLFIVSGMGLYLAIQSRDWKTLLNERFKRIGIPLLFGSITIVPLHWFILQYYYNQAFRYLPNFGHLWFLGNILLYVIIFLPIFSFLKQNHQSKIALFVKSFFCTPLSFVLIFGSFVLEVILVNPSIFEMYAFTLHGLTMGALAFFFGFLMMYSGNTFWQILSSWKWAFFIMACLLFGYRFTIMTTPTPMILLSIESTCWILSILAFAHQYLNKPSKYLNYLKEAAYPVYMLHMIFLYLGSNLIFPLKISVELTYVFLVIFTLASSLAFYELIIRRFNISRVLFGLKKILEI